MKVWKLEMDAPEGLSADEFVALKAARHRWTPQEISNLLAEFRARNDLLDLGWDEPYAPTVVAWALEQAAEGRAAEERDALIRDLKPSDLDRLGIEEKHHG